MAPTPFRTEWSPRLLGRWVLAALLGWTLVIGLALASALHREHQRTIETARIWADASFETDTAYRRWNLRSGGVYVPAGQSGCMAPPCEESNRLPATTPDGRELKLVGPSCMSEQAQDLRPASVGLSEHIVHCHPTRPEHTPRDWENTALDALAEGAAEHITITRVDGRNCFCLMRPWHVTTACVQCHDHFANRAGELIGGVAVAVQLDPLHQAAVPVYISLATGHGVVWLLGATGLLLAARQLRQRVETNDAAIRAWRDSERRYRTLFERMLNGFVLSELIRDENGRPIDALTLEVNATFEKLTGLRAVDVVEHRISEHLPGTAASVVEYGARALRLQEGVRFDIQVPELNRHYEALAYPIVDNQFAIVFTDITEQREAQHRLLLLSKVFMDSIDPIIIEDLDGIITNVNNQVAAIYGWTRDEMIGRPVKLIVPADHHAQMDELIARCKRGEMVRSVETQRVTKSGRVLPVLLSLSPLTDGAGRPLGVVSTTQDLTPHKRTEEALRGSREMLALVIDSIPQYVFWKSAEGIYLGCNQNFAKAAGFEEPAELVGKGDEQLPWYQHADAYHDDDLTVMHSGQPLLGKVEPWTDEAGQMRWVSVNKVPFRNNREEIVGILGTFEDITQRKEAEQQLATRRRYEHAVANCSRILLTDANTDDAIRQALRELREAAEVCRAYVFVNFNDEQDGLCMRQTHEVCAPEIIPQIDNPALQHVPYQHGFERWRSALAAGTAINGRVRDLPQPERDVLEPQSIRSILVLPFWVDGRWNGFLGFDDTRVERVWQAEDVRLLKAAAEMIGACLERQRAEEALAHRNAELQEALAREKYAALKLETTMKTLEAANLELEDQKQAVEAQRQELQAINKELRAAWDAAAQANRELEQTNQRLAEALAEARELASAADAANRAKSEFLANMSHEIRTPMTAIMGFADVLSADDNAGPDTDRAEGNCASPDLREAIETIQRNGNYLLSIVNDILDLSKIEAGRLEVEQAACSLPDILDGVQSLMRVRADAKALAFHVKRDGLLPRTIQTDATRLRQILINLLANAIKFTETGTVCLTVRLLNQDSEHPQVQFDVDDTGIGITEEQLPRLFLPFSQVDTSMSRRFGGTGLGLTISKRLAEALGGTITVASEPGVGSRFSLTIDAGPLDGVAILDEPAYEAVGEQDANPTEVVPLPALPPGTRVLLVEDGPDNQRLISFMLVKAGAEVEVAADGELGVEQALRARDVGKPFDIVLMDMQMPVMDGYEATRRLREAGYERPIIALTAHAMQGDRDRCLAAGCTDFATKPVDRAGLLNTLLSHLTGVAAGTSAQEQE